MGQHRVSISSLVLAGLAAVGALACAAPSSGGPETPESTESPEYPENPENPESDGAAVLAVLDAFEEAWNRHDMDAYAALYAPEADFVNVAGLWQRGRERIAEDHAALHAGRFRTSRLSRTDARVRFVRPDVALAHVAWRLEGVLGAEGGAPEERRGVLLHVLTKDAGRWRIAATHNTALAQGAAGPERRE